MKAILLAYIVYHGTYWGPNTQTFPPIEFANLEQCQEYSNRWAKELRFQIDARQFDIKDFHLHCKTISENS